MPDVAEQPSPPTDRRGRRIYVWWAVALGLLAALGAICWLVVRPVLQARTVLANRIARPDAYVVGCLRSEIAAAAIDDLGGPDHAAATLGLYARMPKSWTPHRQFAIDLLGHCGAAGVPHLAGQVRDDDERLRDAAWRALTSYAALGTLDRLCDDQDSRVRERAISALTETLFPDVRSRVLEVHGTAVVVGAGTDHGLRPGQELMIFRKGAWPRQEPVGIIRLSKVDALYAEGFLLPPAGTISPGDETIMKQPDLKEVRRVAREILGKNGRVADKVFRAEALRLNGAPEQRRSEVLRAARREEPAK